MNPTAPQIDTSEDPSDTQKSTGLMSTHFQALANATFDAIITHENGLITDANQPFEQLFRCERANVLGRLPLSAIVAPDSLNLFLSHLASDTESLHEALLRRLDDSTFIAEIRTRIIHRDGRPVRIAAIRDISERKQSEARNRLFLELLSDLSLTLIKTDVARIIAQKGMRGLGGHIGSFGIVQPDGRDIEVFEAWYATAEERSSRVSRDFPSPMVDAIRTGQPIWIETQDEYIQRYPIAAQQVMTITQTQATACLPLRIKNCVIGVISISFAEPRRFEQSDRDFLMALAHQATQALDRARLYEAEQVARARAEAAADRLMRLQGVISALSRALTPTQVANVVITQGIEVLEARAGSIALLREDGMLDVAHSVGYTEEMLTTWGRIPLSAEVPLSHCIRENTPVWVATRDELARLFPQAYAHTSDATKSLAALPLIVDGHPIGGLGLSFSAEHAFNVEERLLMETLAGHCAQALERARLYEAEAEARAAAEKANEIKVRFLGMISHELRTPLTSIKGFASTLLATDVHFDDHTQRQYLNIIDTETNKLTSLVEQLLDVSRLQAGTLPIRPRPHSLTEIFDIAAVQMQTLSHAHPLDIEVGSRLPLVMADSQRIAQVIVNLVDNACKYSPDGKPIQIRARKQGDFLEIRVSDEGPGIPRKDREYVFEAFQQLERKSGAKRGAGLGLAICKGLVEAHGGRIWVQDRQRRGTCIAFTLPLAQD
jgi:PAS domain S-box-containing protein